MLNILKLVNHSIPLYQLMAVMEMLIQKGLSQPNITNFAYLPSFLFISELSLVLLNVCCFISSNAVIYRMLDNEIHHCWLRQLLTLHRDSQFLVVVLQKTLLCWQNSSLSRVKLLCLGDFISFSWKQIYFTWIALKVMPPTYFHGNCNSYKEHNNTTG